MVCCPVLGIVRLKVIHLALYGETVRRINQGLIHLGRGRSRWLCEYNDRVEPEGRSSELCWPD